MRHLIRLTVSVSFALLLAPISAAAQSGNVGTAGMEGTYRTDSPLSLVFVPNGNSACPVRLRAQHGADGTMRKVDQNRPQGVAQKLHITLTSNDSRQITEAHLKVRGASIRGKLTPSDSSRSNMDYTRNVAVKVRQTTDNEATGDVWVPGMTAVLEVELNSVTFADGGMQWFGPSQSCRFTPDHLMLIAGDSH
jgi:hypothetical protein